MGSTYQYNKVTHYSYWKHMNYQFLFSLFNEHNNR